MNKAGAAAVVAAGLLAIGIVGVAGARELGPFDSTDDANLGLLCNNDVNVLIAIPIVQGDDSDQLCTSHDDDSDAATRTS